jgi:DNA sulfur modification protein DndE
MKKIIKISALLILIMFSYQCKQTGESEKEDVVPTAKVKKTLTLNATSVEEVKALDDEAKRQLGQNIGTQAYIYSIPIVREMLFRNRFSTMVANAKKANKPIFSENGNDGVNINELVHLRILTNHYLETGVTPNVDTQYSPAFIDVSKGPIVITVPKVDRYYSVQMTDAYLENFHYLGGNNKEDYQGNYMLVKPNWKGEKPSSVSKIIEMPTDIGFIVLRILNTTEKGDTQKVVAIQDQFRLQSLNSFLGKGKDNYPVLAKEKMPKGIEFYNSMLKYVRAYPDLKNEAHFWFLMKQIGIDKNENVDFNDADPAMKKGLLQAIPKAKEILSWKARSRGYKSKNNWNIDFIGGSYNGDIMARAEGAVQGFVVHDANQCLYFHTYYDREGNPLLGGNTYTITFNKDQLHQADAFWSIVAYDPEYNLVPRKDLHYAVSDRSEGLQYNEDGSLTIYLQSEEPEGKKNNWVPIPKEGIFKLNFRNYIPKETLLNPKTVENYLPAVEKNNDKIKL